MTTLEKLRLYGADLEDALPRCLNNEGFYLRLVGMAVKDQNLYQLEAALKAGDWKTAFEKAHAVKGVASNLSLKPVLKPIAELTDALRPQAPCDYEALLEESLTQWEKLKQCLAE